MPAVLATRPAAARISLPSIFCSPEGVRTVRLTSRAASCYTPARSAAALGHTGAVHKRGSGAKTARSRDRPSFPHLAHNSYWISGEDEDGEIVLTQAGRIHYWPDTSLEQEARLMLYGGYDEGQLCSVTAPAAKLITGVVFCAGAHWIRPDFRGNQLSHLLARLGRAYAVSRWPVDWGIAIVAPVLVEKGVAAGYGYQHASRSILFPGAPSGATENVLTYLSANEAYEDLEKFLIEELSGSKKDALGTSVLGRPLDEPELGLLAA